MVRKRVRERRSGSPVLDATGSAVWRFGGLPYAAQDAEIDDGTTPQVTIRSTAAGFEVESATGARWAIHAGAIPVDRAAATTFPRPMPPPPEPVAVTAAGRSSRRDTSVPGKLSGSGVAQVDLAGFSDLAGLVARVQESRFVLLSPTAFEDPLTLSTVAVHLTASGVVCALDPAAAPLPGVDPRLDAALRFDPAAIAVDDVAWAAVQARQTRTVALGHDLVLRWDGTGPMMAPAPIPAVSVLLASRRPADIPAALGQIALQETVRPEVVVAVHTPDAGDVDAVGVAMRDLGLVGSVLHRTPDIPLGEVLNAAAERASGSCVTKWDDDDRYGPHHLEDLVVAWRNSGADLVGKRAEFVHFVRTGATIVRGMEGVGKRSMVIAGATLFTTRDRLLAVGGFPPLHRAVDWHLRVRYRDLGLRSFRTHGFGFVMVRRPDGHTWPVTDDELIGGAARTWEGIPDVADV